MNYQKLLKSIGAVLAGFVIVFVLSVGTDALMEAAGILPSFADQMAHGLFDTWLLVLVTGYRTLYTLIGGYAAGRLAPDKPAKHVAILGIIGTLAALGGLIGTWGMGLGPVWYPVALVVLAFPSIWLGGKMRDQKLAITNS